jgi:hypothetical protein
MLAFPPAWLPNVPLDMAQVEQAGEHYQWAGTLGPFRWADQDDLIVVGQYLVGHRSDVYWHIILQGGIRGYSLYLHDLMELKWYNKRGFNPFDSDVQIAHYPVAHSWALLFEHRFLQVVAGMMGYDFSLYELILGNPHGDPPARDWNDVWLNQGRELSAADSDHDPGHMPQVQEFYDRLGFRKVT